MQDFPKIVRARLEEQRPQKPALAGRHPDADLLTAFAEQSLPASERKPVLEHIASCAECRDVVALAFPGPLEKVLAPKRGIQKGRLTLPALRWGVATAGLLAITSVAFFEYQRHYEQAVLTARNLQVAAPLARQSYSSQESSRSNSAPPQTRAEKPAGQDMLADSGRSLRAGAVPPASAVAPKPLRNESAGRAMAASGSSSKAAYDARYGTPQQQRGSLKTFQAPADVVASNVVASNNGADTAAVEPEVVAKAKAVPKEALALGLARPPDLRADPGLMKGHSLVRWTISDKGGLQRSTDGGGSWQDVDVVRATEIQLRAAKKTTTVEVSGAAPVATPEVAISPESRIAARPASQAAQAQSQALIFRAVSVSSDANEVWAGGSGAALFHTVDAGNNWLRVLPSDGGVVLTGDVISIQFPDPQSGTVSTSNSEIWITFDDGKTWHKQP